MVIDGRNWWRKTVGPIDWHSRIFDVGVRMLLEVAFQASLYQEEGRYGRLRFFAKVSDRPRLIIQFNPALPLDANLVRRIMPGVGCFEYGLCVREEDSSLMCDGIVDVGDLGTEQKKRASFERDEGAIGDGDGGTDVVGARNRAARRAVFSRGVGSLGGMWRNVAAAVGAGGAGETDAAAVEG